MIIRVIWGQSASIDVTARPLIRQRHLQTWHERFWWIPRENYQNSHANAFIFTERWGLYDGKSPKPDAWELFLKTSFVSVRSQCFFFSYVRLWRLWLWSFKVTAGWMKQKLAFYIHMYTFVNTYNFMCIKKLKLNISKVLKKSGKTHNGHKEYNLYW